MPGVEDEGFQDPPEQLTDEDVPEGEEVDDAAAAAADWIDNL